MCVCLLSPDSEQTLREQEDRQISAPKTKLQIHRDLASISRVPRAPRVRATHRGADAAEARRYSIKLQHCNRKSFMKKRIKTSLDRRSQEKSASPPTGLQEFP
jgi:hypothetical protein